MRPERVDQGAKNVAIVPPFRGSCATSNGVRGYTVCPLALSVTAMLPRVALE